MRRINYRPLCHCSAATRTPRAFSSNRRIQEHDVLFLRQQGSKYPKWHLTAPLDADSNVKLSYGASVPAAHLIGRNLLDVVHDSKGNRVVLQEPTLSSYIVHSERHATPIYPHDANTIVALLDLNPSRPGEDEDEENAPPFEIFEAGTGMGSLTLHIARAIHAANPPLPPKLRRAICEARFRPKSNPSLTRVDLEPAAEHALDEYRASRRAILHTLDQKPKHTHAAYRLVRNFRRAQYLSSVDFHIGSVGEYLSGRLVESRGEPFLHRAILDLPSAHENAQRVIESLLPNGILILFKPSISQIADFQKWSAETRQPVRLEKVLELPVSTTSDGVHDAGGGRHWDVKTVMPKASASQGGDGKVVQVMRPKVGDRIAGGGFVAVLRRWPADREPVEQEQEREDANEGELNESQEKD
ncbi:tRNA (adenine-N(1)-)-methyltransferase, partial [Metarhizium majus ARSEF 297]